MLTEMTIHHQQGDLVRNCTSTAFLPDLPERGVSLRAGFRREFDKRIALPNGRDAPIDLVSVANAL
jgi:hypothetical protein